MDWEWIGSSLGYLLQPESVHMEDRAFKIIVIASGIISVALMANLILTFHQ